VSGNAVKPLRIWVGTEDDTFEISRLVDAVAFDRWTAKQVLSELERTASTIYLASARGHICGLAIVMRAADEADLLLMAVHPRFRRQGVARKLLDSLTVKLRKSGVIKLSLEVRSTNSSAIRLYQQTGFEMTSVRKGYYRGSAGDGILMTLGLMDCRVE